MSEIKCDPSIKLFGKMIQPVSASNDDLVVTSSKIEPSTAVVSVVRDDIVSDTECTSSTQNLPCSNHDENEKMATDEAGDTKQEGEPSSNSALEEPKTPTSPPSTNTENLESITKDKNGSSQDLPKKNHNQSDQASSNSDSPDQNPLKKPDKILPCARCNSMDTKFCYFNNYNVNQPRHFCKNCQRYWTAGGSMRNVPVGAGRRKSKSCSASQPRHLVIPGSSDGLVHHVMRPDGSILAFGMDPSHPNQPDASMLKVGVGPQNFVPNGFFMSENDSRTSNSSSVTVEKGGNCNGVMENCQTVPCFPYSWNPMTWQPGFPMPFYSTTSPHWGEARPCNLQWIPNPSMNSDQSSTSSCSPSSTSLGKRARDATVLMASNSDKKESSEARELRSSRVLVPKKMRFVDPSEAAKSSICTTLGVKNNNVSSTASRTVALFGELQQPKSGVNYDRATSNIISGVEASSMVLQANPAAFSRSLAFHEIAQ